MERSSSDLVEMISAAMRDIDDAKAYQSFGGDALIVHERTERLSNAARARYRLRLAPLNDKLGVLPSAVDLRYEAPQGTYILANYFQTPIYREDGVFEWLIDGTRMNDFDTYLTVQWIGPAAYQLTLEGESTLFTLDVSVLNGLDVLA